MKKIATMMLMLLVAFMSTTLLSCSSDDDSSSSSEKAAYTLSAALTDKGNLPAEAVAMIETSLSKVSKTVNATLAEAKSKMDSEINSSKGQFPVLFNYTMTFYLKDAAGKVQYSKKIVIKDGNATVE